MKTIALIIIVLGLTGMGLVFFWYRLESELPAPLDAFAQCLAAKNITMYGADWCPRCQNEKKAFGNSFKFVPYIECPENPQRCLALGINGYPTWIFPVSPAGGQDGKKLEGEQGLEKLSQESGCLLE